LEPLNRFITFFGFFVFNLLKGDTSRMGVLRKLGGVVLAYVIIGIIMYILLLNDIISINSGNMIIDFLYTIFSPIILTINFIYLTLPFVP